MLDMKPELQEQKGGMGISERRKVMSSYKGINKIKKGYQPRTNLVKDQNGDLLADSHNVVNRWKNYFCQLLNLHGVNDIRQTEMYTVEPLVPEPSYLKR
jgi:hypothetical protein